MGNESVHQKLSRVRKPHVHITYEVDKDDGTQEIKEIPFVMGILGDFSGHPTQPLKPLSQRKFISIDRDNFNEVMARMTPGLNIRVENTIDNDGSELSLQLQFNSMEDFEPSKIVNQVAQLRKLMETRNKLRDLTTCTDKSEELEKLLEDVLKNTERTQAVAAELPAAPATDKDGDQ